MSQLHIIDHPLIQHKLSIMRDKETNTYDFKRLLGEIGMLMTYEITRDVRLRDKEIDTPICHMVAKEIDEQITLVPILRAGLGMVDGVVSLLPTIPIGHIGLYRDETTHQPVEYLCKMPKNVADHTVLLVDPMLATGGSAIAACDMLKKRGVKKIKFMCLVAAPEGVKAFREAQPDVDIYTASLDDCLNEKAYIVPGLGDCGDRIFGTL